jgi:hypothetical protein
MIKRGARRQRPVCSQAQHDVAARRFAAYSGWMMQSRFFTWLLLKSHG